jgi:hypothetical protein
LDEWLILTKKCYSALKKKEILPFAATKMNLEDITKITQTQKDKYYQYHLYEETVKLIEVESRIVVTSAGREEIRKVLAKGYKGLVVQD